MKTTQNPILFLGEIKLIVDKIKYPGFKFHVFQEEDGFDAAKYVQGEFHENRDYTVEELKQNEDNVTFENIQTGERQTWAETKKKAFFDFEECANYLLKHSWKVVDGFPTKRTRVWRLEPDFNESQIVKTVFSLINFAMEFEIRNSFAYDGVKVFSPDFNIREMIDIKNKLTEKEIENEEKSHIGSNEKVPDDVA